MPLPKLTLTGSSLFDFADSMPEPAHVKSCSDNRYVFSNQSNLGVYGLSKPEQIIGATIYDMDDFMRPFWGNTFAGCVDHLDDQVRKEKNVVTDENRIFLDKFGFLHIQNMTKAPVFNEKNQVKAILTLSHNLARKTDIFVLFDLYKNAYLRKSEAISYFMRYLKIDTLFHRNLTEKELLCLLHMRRNSCYKVVAQSMGIGLKTLETHVSHIIDKLVTPNVSHVLSFMRENL